MYNIWQQSLKYKDFNIIIVTHFQLPIQLWASHIVICLCRTPFGALSFAYLQVTFFDRWRALKKPCAASRLAGEESDGGLREPIRERRVWEDILERLQAVSGEGDFFCWEDAFWAAGEVFFLGGFWVDILREGWSGQRRGRLD